MESHRQRHAHLRQFRQSVQADHPPGAASAKFSSFFFSEIVHTARIPPPHEGRFAIVTDVGSGMRWTRQRARRAR
jgi:hypothetical protein